MLFEFVGEVHVGVERVFGRFRLEDVRVACPCHQLAGNVAIASRIPVQIVLMLRLCLIEVSERQHFGHNRLVVTLPQAFYGLEGIVLLGVGGIVYAGAVLDARVLL